MKKYVIIITDPSSEQKNAIKKTFLNERDNVSMGTFDTVHDLERLGEVKTQDNIDFMINDHDEDIEHIDQLEKAWWMKAQKEQRSYSRSSEEDIMRASIHPKRNVDEHTKCKRCGEDIQQENKDWCDLCLGM